MPAHILVSDNRYLYSTIYETMFTTVQAPNVALQTKTSPYLKPYHAAELVDPLIAQITAARWTSVISNDELLRQLLHSYFLHHYCWNMVFHKDCFLEDMVAGKEQFCSRLLVNSILAAACVSA